MNETNQILAVTEDQNFMFFSIDIQLELESDSQYFSPINQLMGCNEDILDLAIISHDPILKSNRRLAIVTNSSQLRIGSYGSSCSYKPLDGHTDTILAISVSADG